MADMYDTTTLRSLINMHDAETARLLLRETRQADEKRNVRSACAKASICALAAQPR